MCLSPNKPDVLGLDSLRNAGRALEHPCTQKHSTKSCPTLPCTLLLPLSHGVLDGCAVPELTSTATLHRPARLTLRSTWILRPPCSNESVNTSAAAVFAPLPITTPSPSHCLCAAGRATTPYALPRPFPPELMRRYGTHSQHRQAAWLAEPSFWLPQSLGPFSVRQSTLLDRYRVFPFCGVHRRLFMSVFQLTFLQEAFSSGRRRF